MSFDYITNYLKSKTVQIDNYKQLVEKIGVNREAFLHMLPGEIVAELSNKD
jgi:GTP cyclohydrolase III